MPDTEPEDLLLTAAEIQDVTNRDMPTELAQAIARMATDAVRDYCGWRVAKTATETVTVASRGGHSLFVPSLNIVSIGSVTENGVTIDEPADYDWDESGILYRGGRGHRRWHTGRRAVTVTLTHGYEKCPGGIAQAIASAVARGALVPSGLISETAVGQTRQYGRTGSGAPIDAGFTPEELTRLDSHRLRNNR
ncbi:hypothetical protein [Microbacterium oleivorans]|uniref:Phage gp6-like head-tail connector protein n=1 Tax=Microbacterium oleivorans TaxID=273677 RepID=A0A4R5YK98_9MICO|nr:hypothetical protein [Microbacterium oleivorans]TDL43837.1 hypothetical protein E2R54_11650 [Microbacterium oleivorans]